MKAILFALVAGFSLIGTGAFAIESSPTLHPKGAALPFSHQGPFVTTGDGGILCVDAANALHSKDEGVTWTSTPIFRDATKFTISNERALLRTREGVIVAAWMNMKELKSLPKFKWGGPIEEFNAYILPTYVCRSLDDGKTWEEPIKLNTPWCGCIHSMIQTKEGRIVLVGQEIIPEWRHATVMFVSDDEGKTWKRSNVLDIGQGRHDHAGSCEGTVVERKDGTLYELLRTETGWLYEAVSRNGGLKWEDFQPSKIKSVTCCAQMARLTDGRVALLWNHPPRHDPTSPSSRQELSIAFSEDDARTWSKPVVVAANYDGARARVSYPYLYERHPGELWITTMQGGLRMKIQAADLDKGEIPKFIPLVSPAPKPGGIVMFGDSTTAVRPGAIDKVYAQRIAEALKSAGSTISVHNAGIGGNTTRAALARLQRDVLDYKPGLIVIQFGINDSAIDVWRKPPATESRIPLAEYEANLRSMIDQARKQGAKVILMTTNPLRWTDRLKEMYGKPPYLPNDPHGFEAPLIRYNDAVRKLASDLKLPLVDVYAAYPAFAVSHKRTIDELLLDGMHPGDSGHQLVAELLLPVIRKQL
ncbi:MAG: exo-alpha-sialidase [Prosthecobacter sp.]|nr:exo-alpha-sialidase [Prosthecobacter sp.]